MPFLSSFGIENKADKSVAARARRPYTGVSGSPYAADWDTERIVKDGYERVIWVYRAVDAIAYNASLPRPLLQIDGIEDISENPDPLLKLMTSRANDAETSKAFRYRLSSQLLLSKRGVFVEMVRSRSGELTSLHLLPPHRTAPVPGVRDFVDRYVVTLPDGDSVNVAAENVLWIRKPHPLDPYSSVTPIQSAALSIDADYYARLYNRNFLMNDGRPGGILAVKGQIDIEDARELEARFSGRGENAGRTSVMEADDLTWIDTSTSPRDAQYIQSRAITKEEILLSFGVPESVIGNASGRTYDNADAEREIFWEATMKPHLDLIAQALESATEGGWDDGIVLAFDFDAIPALGRSIKTMRQTALSDFQAGAISLDEYRATLGREPIGSDVAESSWIAAGRLPATEGIKVPDPAAPAAPAPPEAKSGRRWITTT